PGPPGGPHDPQRGRGRPRRRIRPFRWIFLLLVLWLAFLIAVPFFAFSKVSTVDAFPEGDRPGEQDGTTYLVVGSDSRSDLSDEERRRFGTGGEVGKRTDTMMILHIGKGPNLLMSIPRDSIVDIPGRGSNKINASYSFGGPKLLVETIEQNTGIRIDHYVEIGFGGFVNLVDAVGGIEICPDRDMSDRDAHLDIKKGCQEADGVTALGFARSRKSDPQYGDITRAKNQRSVVSAIGNKVVSPWTVINPVRYWKVNMAAATTVKVSDGTGPVALGRFAWGMTRQDLTCGVPIADLEVNWDEKRSKKMFDYIANDDTESIPEGLCSPTGLAE
ncbi:MAG TPA: LCP family protein, partial [Nocardioides sp.]